MRPSGLGGMSGVQMASLCFSLHPLPDKDEGESQVKFGGEGILLDGHAPAAWKEAGESCEAISSQPVLRKAFS